MKPSPLDDALTATALRLAALERENERLREALETIANSKHIGTYWMFAREALRESGGGDA